MNWLKFNDTKTEFAIYGSKQNLSKVTTTSISVGDVDISPSDSVKILGAHLDSTLDMDKQISASCKAAWFHLYKISKIRKYLTQDQTQSVIHAYVTCRLDQHNGLLIGLPKKSTNRLQSVQNAAARLIVGLRKRDHITPVLRTLHWLPIEQRIVFKVLLITYKCLHGEGPGYLTELLCPYIPSRSL